MWFFFGLFVNVYVGFRVLLDLLGVDFVLGWIDWLVNGYEDLNKIFI